MSDKTASLGQRLNDQLAETRRLNDEARGLTARQLLPGSTRLVLAQLPATVTLRDAAGRVAEAYNLLHGGVFNRVAERRGELRLSIDDREFPFNVSDPEAVFRVMEETLFFTHALLVLVGGDLAREAFVGVALRRRRGKPDVPFASIGEVRRGTAAYALRYDAALASREVIRPTREDLTYQAVIRTQIALLREAEGTGASTRDVVLNALRAGAADQAAVAARIGVSPATLRRRLSGEGERFRDLTLEVMTERADALLATPAPLPEIADRLGYSDIRSFIRAYRRATGRTPTQARLSESVHRTEAERS